MAISTFSGWATRLDYYRACPMCGLVCTRRWRPLTGNRNDIMDISTCIHDSNKIPKAMLMFWGSGNTTRLLQRLPRDCLFGFSVAVGTGSWVFDQRLPSGYWLKKIIWFQNLLCSTDAQPFWWLQFFRFRSTPVEQSSQGPSTSQFELRTFQTAAENSSV